MDRLFLQPHRPSASAVVATHGTGLVETTPAGPVQHRLWWSEDAHDQPIDQPPDFRHGERDQLAMGGQLRQERPPLSTAPGSHERTAAR